jgi:hypothetical protein
MRALKTINDSISVARNAGEGSDTDGDLTGRGEDEKKGGKPDVLVVGAGVKRVHEEGRAGLGRESEPDPPG